jgi:hypothetical protein
MTLLRATGIAIAVAGAVFLYFGVSASDAPLDQANTILSDNYTDHTLWYIAGGLGATIAGISMALPGIR